VVQRGDGLEVEGSVGEAGLAVFLFGLGVVKGVAADCVC